MSIQQEIARAVVDIIGFCCAVSIPALLIASVTAIILEGRK